MKKILCLVVALSVVLSCFNFVFASDGDAGLENAILTAKEILEISDDEYVIDDFRSSNYGYELSWKTKDENKNGWISATVKDNEIVSYYKSAEGDYSRISITDMSSEAAKLIADEFALKACPTAFSLSKHIDTQFYRYDGGVFNITYQRYHNDIPVQNQITTVNVSTIENKVVGFDTTYDKNLIFEDAQGIISFEDAKKSFEENFGYELKYVKKYDENGKNSSAYLAYVPKSDFYNQYIDAKTGEVFKTDYASLNTAYSSAGARNMAMAAKEEAVMDTASVLSKEEKLLSEEVAMLPSKEEIIKLVKDIAEFKIDDTYTEKYFSVYKLSDGKYFANIEFSKNSGEGDEEPYYYYKNIYYNLTDNKLAKYYNNENKDYTDKEKIAESAVCQKVAEEFLKKYYSVENDSVKYKDNGSEYNFYYERIYDGIGVEGDGITINFDKYTGEIASVDYNWSETTFDSKDNIKSIEEFYKTIITNDVFEPMYITYRTYDENGRRSENYATKLVYMLEDYSSNYSAVTLKKIDYLGEEQKELTYNYTDIENHYVKLYAQKLAEIDIGLEGDKLNPDESILKEDYLALIAKVNDDWHGPLNEDFLKTYIRRGIIEEDDKNLDEPIKRIDAVRFMINNLGYKEVAQKYDIFKCPFIDVSDEMKGYGALGAALNIVSDSTDILNADELLTRADALIIVYNFLSRE